MSVPTPEPSPPTPLVLELVDEQGSVTATGTPDDFRRDNDPGNVELLEAVGRLEAGETQAEQLPDGQALVTLRVRRRLRVEGEGDDPAYQRLRAAVAAIPGAQVVSEGVVEPNAEPVAVDGFFAYSVAEGFDRFLTEEDARQEAARRLDADRDVATHGEAWPEFTDRTCYGRILGVVAETDRFLDEDAPEEVQPWDVVHYSLRPVAATPTTDLGDRLRTLAAWCDRHGVTSEDVVDARCLWRDDEVHFSTNRPGGLDAWHRLTNGVPVRLGKPYADARGRFVRHDHATVDGVPVVIVVDHEPEALPPEPGEPTINGTPAAEFLAPVGGAVEPADPRLDPAHEIDLTCDDDAVDPALGGPLVGADWSPPGTVHVSEWQQDHGGCSEWFRWAPRGSVPEQDVDGVHWPADCLTFVQPATIDDDERPVEEVTSWRWAVRLRGFAESGTASKRDIAQLRADTALQTFAGLPERVRFLPDQPIDLPAALLPTAGEVRRG